MAAKFTKAVPATSVLKVPAADLAKLVRDPGLSQTLGVGLLKPYRISDATAMAERLIDLMRQGAKGRASWAPDNGSKLTDQLANRYEKRLRFWADEVLPYSDGPITAYRLRFTPQERLRGIIFGVIVPILACQNECPVDYEDLPDNYSPITQAGYIFPPLWLWMNSSVKGGSKGQKELLQSVAFWVANYFLTPIVASMPYIRKDGKTVYKIPDVNNEGFTGGLNVVKDWVPIRSAADARGMLEVLQFRFRFPLREYCRAQDEGDVDVEPNPCEARDSTDNKMKALRGDDSAQQDEQIAVTNAERAKLCAVTVPVIYLDRVRQPGTDWTSTLITVATAVASTVAMIVPGGQGVAVAGYISVAGTAANLIYKASTTGENIKPVLEGIGEGFMKMFDETGLIKNEDVSKAIAIIGSINELTPQDAVRLALNEFTPEEALKKLGSETATSLYKEGTIGYEKVKKVKEILDRQYNAIKG